jgi:hypothetical protein
MDIRMGGNKWVPRSLNLVYTHLQVLFVQTDVKSGRIEWRQRTE